MLVVNVLSVSISQVTGEAVVYLTQLNQYVIEAIDNICVVSLKVTAHIASTHI